MKYLLALAFALVTAEQVVATRLTEGVKVSDVYDQRLPTRMLNQAGGVLKTDLRDFHERHLALGGLLSTYLSICNEQLGELE
jgi:hypothetical protein